MCSGRMILNSKEPYNTLIVPIFPVHSFPERVYRDHTFDAFSTTAGSTVKILTSDSGSATSNQAEDTLNIVGGEGIDTSGTAKTITVTGEDASTSNKGVASFDSDHFTVSSGAVTLKTVTRYWSASGIDWVPKESGSDGVWISGTPDELAWIANGAALESRGSVVWYLPVHLPDGAIVTSVQVWGEDATETWTMNRSSVSSPGASAMASANIDSADTSITNATIDNSAYSYYIVTSSFDNGEEIHGTVITYTIDQLA